MHPHGAAPYSVAINGGLPLSRGVQTFLTRHRWVYLSALLLGVCVVMLVGEEKQRPQDMTADELAAREHWSRRMQETKDKVLDTVFPQRDK